MLKLKLQCFGHLMWRSPDWKRPWCWGRLKAGEGDDRGWDGWKASPTQWTWVWVNSRSWWWTGRPGVLQAMGSQRVGHDWATELNWTALLMWHHVLPTRLSSILESWCAGSMLVTSFLSILQVDIELSDYSDHTLLPLELEESVHGDCCIRQIWVKGNILSSVLLQLTCQFCLFLKWMFSWIACPFLLQKYRHLLHSV